MQPLAQSQYMHFYQQAIPSHSEQCTTCFHTVQSAVTPPLTYFPPLEKQEKQLPNADTATNFHYTCFSNDIKNNVQVTFSTLHP